MNTLQEALPMLVWSFCGRVFLNIINNQVFNVNKKAHC